MQGPIQSVEVSYMVHSTEDPERIRGAVARLFSTDSEAELERLEGHYGNAILRARLHLTGAEAGKAFDAMVVGMPQGVKAEVSSSIGDFVDEHSALFVRFDKQKLVSGQVALGSGDAVRVKVKPRIFIVRGGAAQFYLKLLGRA